MANQPLERVEIWVDPVGEKRQYIPQDNIPDYAVAAFLKGDPIFEDLRTSAIGQLISLEVKDGVELEGYCTSINPRYTEGVFMIVVGIPCNYTYDGFTKFMNDYYS